MATRKPDSVLPASLALFAASGCAALIYQVVWFERLSLVLGTSAISLGVLLAAFMGGMCLGGLWLPRFVAAHRAPLRVFAALELGVGVLGFAALAIIPAVGSAYTAWGGTGLVDLTLRAFAAAVCLLPATVLMGATLPAVARWVETVPNGAAWLGLCYAANLGGAMIGSLAAGFYLLRRHDAYVATFVAAALNFSVAAAGVWLAGRAAPQAALPIERRALVPARSQWPIYVATGLSGFTALSAEVLWTRHLSLLFGGTVYTFALILAVLMFGFGLGSAAGAVLGRRVDAGYALGGCQLLLAAALAWAAYVIAQSLPYWPFDVTLPTTAAVALQIDTVRTAWAVLPAALLWGASFPLALAAAVVSGTDPRRYVGRLYATNTAGAIAGALLTTFVLVVTIGGQRTQQLSIFVAAAAGLVVLTSVGRRGGVKLGAAVLVVAAAGVLAYTVDELPPALVAYGRFLPTRGADANVVYVGEGLTASIAVTREPSGILTYHNAGKTQASTYPQDLRLQRMLGHLATLTPERPSNVLVIGLGAGITAGAVSIDPAVEHVVVAEIEPLVSQAAGEFFTVPNFGVVTNPKVEVNVDDGRHYLATTDWKFDAITSDPLDTWVKGAATLYTREFWQLCKSRLNDGGVVTVFLQFYETTEDAVQSEIATFFTVFPNGALFANRVDGMGYDAVLFGRVGDAPIDVERITRTLAGAQYAQVAGSLHDVGFDSALELLGTYAGGAGDMAKWLDSAAINTDRNLRLQYLAGGGLNAYRAGDIFDGLIAGTQRFPDRLFIGTPAELEELRQRVGAHNGSD
ncbi:MAG: fused MFS/spermidine synthase [Gammaproteobacteria bacterium]